MIGRSQIALGRRGMMNTVKFETGSIGTGVLSLLLVATAAGAQEQDNTGWWDAEELLSGQAELQTEPQVRLIATDANRVDRNVRLDGRDRSRGSDGYEDRDRYNDRGRNDNRDRYNDRGRKDNRYRGPQAGIVIPGGRVQIRRRLPAGRYGRGSYAYRRPQWQRVQWNVRFRNDDRYGHDNFRPRLRDIVGRDAVRRLQRHRNRVGARGALTYRWVSLGRRGEILQVRAGRRPIAEFVNFGRDNRVDVVRLVR
jgi:hypothetical protein